MAVAVIILMEVVVVVVQVELFIKRAKPFPQVLFLLPLELVERVDLHQQMVLILLTDQHMSQLVAVQVVEAVLQVLQVVVVAVACDWEVVPVHLDKVHRVVQERVVPPHLDPVVVVVVRRLQVQTVH